MSPASRSTRNKGSAGSGKARSPRCRTCNRAIRVPNGWAPGSAIRRHYWAKHPEVMRGKKGRGK